jgi:hypothetical protein
MPAFIFELTTEPQLPVPPWDAGRALELQDILALEMGVERCWVRPLDDGGIRVGIRLEAADVAHAREVGAHCFVVAVGRLRPTISGVGWASMLVSARPSTPQDDADLAEDADRGRYDLFNRGS